MRLLVFATLFFIGLNGLYAQSGDKPRKSPLMNSEMDMGDVKVKIQYGSPSVNGRKIFGELVPYGKVWRTGANEATVFEVNKDIVVEGKVLKAGKYSMFTIPNEDKWVIVFNSVWEQWGAYKYNKKKDVLRVEVKSELVPDSTERFTIKLENGFMFIIWEQTVVQVALN